MAMDFFIVPKCVDRALIEWEQLHDLLAVPSDDQMPRFSTIRIGRYCGAYLVSRWRRMDDKSSWLFLRLPAFVTTCFVPVAESFVGIYNKMMVFVDSHSAFSSTCKCWIPQSIFWN
jgi:hypothetical protein